MASEEKIFLILVHKFNFSVAMETNQIQQFGQNAYGS